MPCGVTVESFLLFEKLCLPEIRVREEMTSDSRSAMPEKDCSLMPSLSSGRTTRVMPLLLWNPFWATCVGCE